MSGRGDRGTLVGQLGVMERGSLLYPQARGDGSMALLHGYAGDAPCKGSSRAVPCPQGTQVSMESHGCGERSPGRGGNGVGKDLYHCVTMPSCHCATVPSCHHVIMPLCHTMPSCTVPPCHRSHRTALMLACEHRSLESAELLLSHGAVVGDEDCWHYGGQTPSRVLRRLLRSACGEGRGESPPAVAPTHHHPYGLAWLLILGGKKGKRGLFLFLLAENGAGCAGDPAPQVGSQGEETLGSDSEEEDKEGEEQQDGSDAWRVQRLQARLARKTRECQRLAATATSIRQQVRELAQLLPGCKARDGMEDEDGACLTLLAQHMGELRKRMLAEGDGGHQTMAQLDGDDGVPALASFLTWLGDECTKMRAAKASAFTRSKGLRKEVEEALRSKLHYEVVSADAVRRSLVAWEKMVVGLEQTLSRADETHTKMLQGSRILLENLQREPVRPLAGTAPCQCPVNGTELGPGGKSQEELLREGGNLEKEMLELKESNGMLLGELARLGRERERLQEELRGLREQDPDAEPVAEGAGAAALARALAAKRDEVVRLRRRMAGQRRELAVLRDGVGKRVQEAASDASAGILRELHLKLDGLVRSQHEALQLVAEMEGEGTPGEGAPHSDGDGGAGLLGEVEDALGELVEELGTASGPRVPQLLERLAGTTATLRGWAFLGEQREQPGAEAKRWQVAAAEEKRAKEAAVAQAAEREREAQELREKAEGLERSVGSLRARVGELSRACRDKEGKVRTGRAWDMGWQGQGPLPITVPIITVPFLLMSSSPSSPCPSHHHPLPIAVLICISLPSPSPSHHHPCCCPHHHPHHHHPLPIDILFLSLFPSLSPSLLPSHCCPHHHPLPIIIPSCCCPCCHLLPIPIPIPIPFPSLSPSHQFPPSPLTPTPAFHQPDVPGGAGFGGLGAAQDLWGNHKILPT